MSSSVKGFIYVLFAGFLWGISGTIAQFLFTRHIQVMQVVQTRASFAFLILFFFLLIFRRSSLKFQKNKINGWLVAGIVGVAGANFTYYSTIKLSTVGTAILIQYTAPILVLAYNLFTKLETPNFIKILALCTSLFGCFLAIGTGTEVLFKAGWMAVAVGFASAICFATIGILGRYQNTENNSDLLQNLVFTLMFATLFWCFFDFPSNWINWNLNSSEWMSLVGFSIISVLIPYIFFFLGLKNLTASSVMIIQTMEPICAIVTAWIFLGETMVQTQIVGTLLVISAIILLGFASSKTNQLKN